MQPKGCPSDDARASPRVHLQTCQRPAETSDTSGRWPFRFPIGSKYGECRAVVTGQEQVTRDVIRYEVDAKLSELGYGCAWHSWDRATLRLHDSDGSIVRTVTLKAGVTSRKRLDAALAFLPVAGPARHFTKPRASKAKQFCLLEAIQLAGGV